MQSDSLQERVHTIERRYPDFRMEDICSFQSGISDGLLRNRLAFSILTPPRVWIRMNQKSHVQILEEFKNLNINFITDSQLPNALSLNPGVHLEPLITFKSGLFKVQDRSSQLAGNRIPAKESEQWWDCCCGAGGKSLQLMDRFPGIKITATDSRASILDNFSLRLSENERQKVGLYIADLEQPPGDLFEGKMFDGIIADVPCSGSGTWGRTPEMLCYFDEDQIANFVLKQRKILVNALPFLKVNGKLIYITCSVFRAENEEMVDFISTLPGMQLQDSSIIDGISQNSDSMFYAIFSRIAE
ncbi:MAG: hypothetical protein IPP71_06510 [Bacteroidetes bacterium]|nr:hypothetical protein [Bacteroidota bacterium]